MCGIWGVLLKGESTEEQELNFYKSYMKISHRGPDRSIFTKLSKPVNAFMGFHRLSIMDVSTKADQPFKITEGNRTIYVMCNGEIYRHQDLVDKYELKPTSGSDCEVIPLLYHKFGREKSLEIMSKEFNSEHAFVILDIDMKTGDYTAIFHEDRFGIRPLFCGEDEYGFYFSSELKGLPCLDNLKAQVQRFKPRNYMIIEKKEGKLSEPKYTEYYSLRNFEVKYTDLEEAKTKIRETLTQAVIDRLSSDRPFGALLSGGLDSSTLSAISQQYLKKSGKKLRTFCGGMAGSTDLHYAKIVADHIGSDHTSVEFTEEELLSYIPDVIKTIESYDITTVRASCIQYGVSKWISQNTDIKMLILGEFCDEILQGYLYFHLNKNAIEGHLESIRLVEDIHLYDGLRCDRGVARWGLEARLPFADYHFIEVVMQLDPKLKLPINGIEKWILREALADTKLLPEEVRTRGKVAQSDGCSSRKKSWYEMIQEQIEGKYTDKDLEEAKDKYKHLAPISKESLYYREQFCKSYGTNESVQQVIPYYWMPKFVKNVTEPSNRFLEKITVGIKTD